MRYERISPPELARQNPCYLQHCRSAVDKACAVRPRSEMISRRGATMMQQWCSLARVAALSTAALLFAAGPSLAQRGGGHGGGGHGGGGHGGGGHGGMGHASGGHGGMGHAGMGHASGGHGGTVHHGGSGFHNGSVHHGGFHD